MTHPRQLIREAAKAVLDGATIAGNRIDSSRKSPRTQRAHARSDAEDLPAISIYTRNTKSDVFDESPRRYKCIMDLMIEAVLEINDQIENIDDALDDFEAEIQELILSDDTLAGTADDVQLVSSEFVISDIGEKLLGAVIIGYAVTYYVYYPSEESGNLDDLSKVYTEHDLSGEQPDSDDRAVSHIEGLET